MDSALIQCAAVLFDFDGTLADSYAAIAASVNHVRHLHHEPPLSLEEIKKHVGRGPDYLIQHTVPGCTLPADVEAYRAHHPSVMLPLTHLLPGAADLLHALHQRGKRIGLCSNKPRNFSKKLLQHLGLAELFTLVLGPEDVARPKPAPDMLLRALHDLNISASQAIYFGDMTVDIQTARQAGVPVWIVATGSDERQTLVDARPDRLFASLTDVVAELGAG